MGWRNDLNDELLWSFLWSLEDGMWLREFFGVEWLFQIKGY
jgi:hypothetical protein